MPIGVIIKPEIRIALLYLVFVLLPIKTKIAPMPTIKITKIHPFGNYSEFHALIVIVYKSFYHMRLP